MRLVVLVQGLHPGTLAEAPIAIGLAKPRRIAMSRHANAAEQGVAHEHSEPASVAHNRFDAGGVGRSGVQHRSGVLPFVHQAAIDAAHDQAQPSDDVLQLLGALVLGNGAVKAAECLGQVAK